MEYINDSYQKISSKNNTSSKIKKGLAEEKTCSSRDHWSKNASGELLEIFLKIINTGNHLLTSKGLETTTT